MQKLYVLFFCLALGNPMFTSARQKMIAFKAASNFIQYTGRFEIVDSGYLKTSAPGAYINFTFEGPDCKLKILDENKWGKNHNYLQVVIDDSLSYRIKLASNENEITLAKNLAVGPHKVTVTKDTESEIGFVIFKDIITQNLLPPDPKPIRKIECVENFITAGMGNDATALPCNAGEWYDQHNVWNAYGPLTARALKAQWYLTAVSGIGLRSSYCGHTTVMPELYDRTNLQIDKPPWDFTKYQADALIVCLGQNDGIQDSVTFVNAYIDFLHKLRNYYPNTEIIMLSSPMSNNTLRNTSINYCTSVKNQLHKKGDSRIDILFFYKQYSGGCGSHPDGKEQIEIAYLLTNFIKSKMNW